MLSRFLSGQKIEFRDTIAEQSYELDAVFAVSKPERILAKVSRQGFREARRRPLAIAASPSPMHNQAK